jgi:hypothetical protein
VICARSTSGFPASTSSDFYERAFLLRISKRGLRVWLSGFKNAARAILEALCAMPELEAEQTMAGEAV